MRIMFEQYLSIILKMALLVSLMMTVMLDLTPRHKSTPPDAWLHAPNSISFNVDFKHRNDIHDGRYKLLLQRKTELVISFLPF